MKFEIPQPQQEQPPRSEIEARREAEILFIISFWKEQ